MFRSNAAPVRPARVVVPAQESPLPRMCCPASGIARTSAADAGTPIDNVGAVVPSVTLAAAMLKICRYATAAVVLRKVSQRSVVGPLLSRAMTVPAT